MIGVGRFRESTAVLLRCSPGEMKRYLGFNKKGKKRGRTAFGNLTETPSKCRFSSLVKERGFAVFQFHTVKNTFDYSDALSIGANSL